MSPNKSYTREELYFYIVAGVAGLVAYALSGLAFILSLVIGMWLWVLVFIVWMLWRSWYTDREDKRLRDKE
jgi:Flp pilus assembly protein TadB